jgi:hypothetical protein
MFGYACDRCREKHQSCNHELPCKRCIKANVADSCHYTPKRTRSKNTTLTGAGSIRHHTNGGFTTRGMGVSMLPNGNSQGNNHIGMMMNSPNGMMIPPHMMHPDALFHMMMNNPVGAHPYMMGMNGNNMGGLNNSHPMTMMMDPSGVPYFGAGPNGNGRHNGENTGAPMNSTVGSMTSPPMMMMPVGGMFPPYHPMNQGMMEEQMMHMGMMNHQNSSNPDVGSQLPPFMPHPMMFPFPPHDSMMPMILQNRQSQSGQGSNPQSFTPMPHQHVAMQGHGPHSSKGPSQSQTPLQTHPSLPMLPHPYGNIGSQHGTSQREGSAETMSDGSYHHLDGSSSDLRRSITPGNRGQDGSNVSVNGSSTSLEKLSLPAMDHHRLSGSGLFPMPQQSSQHLQTNDSGAPIIMPHGFPFVQRKSNSALGEALLFPQDMLSHSDEFNPGMLPMLASFQSQNPSMMSMGTGPIVPFPQGYTFPPIQFHGSMQPRNHALGDSNANNTEQSIEPYTQRLAEPSIDTNVDENADPSKANRVNPEVATGKINAQAPLPTMFKLLNSEVISPSDAQSQ